MRDSFEVEGWKVQVYEALERTCSMKVYNGPQKTRNARTVRLLFELQNASDEADKINDHGWSLIDTDGYFYKYGYSKQLYRDESETLLHPVLSSETIEPQGCFKGYIAFEIPFDAEIVAARYALPAGYHAVDIPIELTRPKVQLPTQKTQPEHNSEQPETWWQPFVRRLVDRIVLWLPESADANEKAEQPELPAEFFQPTNDYQLIKPVSDFYGTIYIPRPEAWTFVERHPPYEGLHVLVFEQLELYLHESVHKEILDNFAQFFVGVE